MHSAPRIADGRAAVGQSPDYKDGAKTLCFQAHGLRYADFAQCFR